MVGENAEVNQGNVRESLEQTTQRVATYLAEKYKSPDLSERVSYSQADEHIYIGKYVGEDGSETGEVRVYPMEDRKFMLFLNTSPNPQAAFELGKLLQDLNVGATMIRVQGAYDLTPEEEEAVDKYSSELKKRWTALQNQTVENADSTI